MASLPEKDRHNYTKEWLIGSLAMFFGGRVAEELVFGAGQGHDRAPGTTSSGPPDWPAAW